MGKSPTPAAFPVWMSDFLSDPSNLPPEFTSWLVDYVQNNATSVPSSSITGLVDIPVGGQIDFDGTPTPQTPTNYLPQSGQVVAQASYPLLYNVVGTKYNTGGEGAGNFRLRSLAGSIIRAF